MLASLPLPWLLLMAAVATFVFCSAMAAWIPGRRGKVVFPLVSLACCLGIVLVGQFQYQHWSPRHMLVLYSFAWVGITIGLFPSRKLMRRYAEEINRGVKREKYPLPARYVVAAVASVVVMSFLAYGLTQ
ncbi:hypothetical protein [Streptomyces paromomycinus]|uniref:Uncharacterized protein n=1 Tax=Streptomyces paromomycinus TaxID=92743 RepID=A0A401VYW7_STREY|nr:hypothetical protein [Streptomyces paromomycinus]GCD42246.1 hypothetical protein GKJPGBOP_01905 [Streptomyces paromomycinus]